MSFDLSHRIAGLTAAALLGAAFLAGPMAASAQQPAAPPAMQEAAPAPAAPPAAEKRAHPSRMSRVEARIKSLHAQLKITPEQSAEWDAVAQAMRDNAKTLEDLATERAKHRATMNAVEDLKSYEAIADAHAEGLKKLVPAFEALYAKMSDAQKKNADAVFGRHPRRPAAKKSG